MPHTPSLNARLTAVAALALVACGAAAFSLLLLGRSGNQQRLARAEQLATNSVERLRAGRLRPLERGRGVRSGVLSAQGFSLEGPMPPAVAREAIGSISSDEVSTATREKDGALTVGAALRDEQGRVLWAVAVAPVGAKQPLLRLVVLVLALSGLASAALAIRTARSVRDGARVLNDGISRLETDLGAPIDTPAVLELATVAERVRLMAAALVRAQSERATMASQLAANERLAALGRIAAGVAHEVRNPLASMKLRVDLAGRNRAVPDEVREDLTVLSAEIARLDRLVADLLALSRKSPSSVKREPRSLGELVRKRAAMLEPWADEKNVAIEVSGDAVAPIDEDAVARAIDNLLRNAVEASPRGAAVRAVIQSRNNTHEIKVMDQGQGVPRERERELFEPFFTTKGNGTGLGLALARATAESHGGTVTYRREGAQTVFALYVAGSTQPWQPSSSSTTNAAYAKG
jgi:signal transduction histidine kinase